MSNKMKKDKKPADSELYLNRELSWLKFNNRVLEEAKNAHNPLFERVRFLSISAKNLDEFYMVRIAGLKAQIHENITELSHDGRTAKEQLCLLQEKVKKIIQHQQKTWKQLKSELEESEIFLLETNHLEEELIQEEQVWLKGLFLKEIFPLLTPIAVDPSHPFPFISNLGFSLVLELCDRVKKVSHKALIALPTHYNRFIELPQRKHHFVSIEQLILRYAYILFPDHEIESHGLFRVLRDTEMYIDEEAEDLVLTFENALKKRRKGNVIRLTINDEMPKSLQAFLQDELGVASEDVFVQDELVGIANIEELIRDKKTGFLYPPFTPRYPQRLLDVDSHCFAAIDQGDFIVHHPYESFDVVVQFLQQAARDPKVVVIKQTLYRTSDNSPIVRALIQAAEAGKSVTAMVELKARFDEEKNIQWARDLERAGAQVIYGVTGLKTHAKVSLVIRQNGHDLKSYVHFGTGNYHPITAKIYTDLSFFSADPVLCQDTAFMFNYMTGYALPKKLKKLAIAPLTLRDRLLTYIDAEIQFAKKGMPASIWLKLNSLVDPQMINKLYEASNAGVKIQLVIRGICCLRPGVKGMSDNITVKSIVGRFLEHARILCFGNGAALPSDQALVFLSSADWMPRNLDRRVEVLVPLEDSKVKKHVLSHIMVTNLKDEASSWILDAEGNYERIKSGTGAFSAHDYFIQKR